MDSSVSPKEETWFLRVCHHISTGIYLTSKQWTQRNVSEDLNVHQHYSDSLKYQKGNVAPCTVRTESDCGAACQFLK